MDKRTFLKSTALLGMGATAGLSALGRPRVQNPELPVEGGAADEENFWKQVRGMYKVKPDYINLENGYYCIQPQEILTAYLQHIMVVNLRCVLHAHSAI